MIRRASGIVLFASLLIAQGCSVATSSLPHKATRDVVATAQHVAGTAIEVKAHNGSVDVVADTSLTEVSIEATLKCAGSSQAEAEDRVANATLIIDRRDDQTLFIRPSFPGERLSRDGCSIKVRVPDAMNVTITSSNGPCNVSGFAGVLDVRTSNGPVNATDHDGEAQLDTSNGPIVATNINGPINADTSNAHITLTNVGGPVTADTSNGHVTIMLAAGQNGPLVVDTSNANVSVTVDRAFRGAVQFETSNGKTSIVDADSLVTRSSFDSKHRDGFVVVGNDDSQSLIDTSNGSITFVIQ